MNVAARKIEPQVPRRPATAWENVLTAVQRFKLAFISCTQGQDALDNAKDSLEEIKRTESKTNQDIEKAQKAHMGRLRDQAKAGKKLLSTDNAVELAVKARDDLKTRRDEVEQIVAELDDELKDEERKRHIAKDHLNKCLAEFKLEEVPELFQQAQKELKQFGATLATLDNYRVIGAMNDTNFAEVMLFLENIFNRPLKTAIDFSVGRDPQWREKLIELAERELD